MISSLELAKICGISQGTVDRALHDRPGVSEKTKAKVLAAAAKHGYRPNQAARALLHDQRSELRVIVGTANSPFYMDQIAALQAALPADLRLHIALGGGAERLDLLAEAASARCAAGVLINHPGAPGVPAQISRDLPVFALINPTPGATAILPDEVATGRLATEHLVGLGHRRILHLRHPGSGNWAIDSRSAGYEQAMRSHRLRPGFIHQAEELPALLRSGDCTAVFCHNDWLTLACAQSLATAGLRVPDDCSLIGVDGSPTIAQLRDDLSTMTYPFDAIAEKLVAKLQGRRGKKLPTCQLTEGRTCAPPC